MLTCSPVRLGVMYYNYYLYYHCKSSLSTRFISSPPSLSFMPVTSYSNEGIFPSRSYFFPLPLLFPSSSAALTPAGGSFVGVTSNEFGSERRSDTPNEASITASFVSRNTRFFLPQASGGGYLLFVCWGGVDGLRLGDGEENSQAAVIK